MRAVVIGASIGGLLAARALADYAESVTVVDRDMPPDAAVPRKGVPQGRHVHGLLAGGLDALRFFFPSILDDLAAEGAIVVDTAQDVLWFSGAWRLRCKCGVIGCLQTRPFLELYIRRRVAKLPNVHDMRGVSVGGNRDGCRAVARDRSASPRNGRRQDGPRRSGGRLFWVRQPDAGMARPASRPQ
jgi:2-polyprenyl-6-methoxyphenol hydroxylase-like FAD-dependent oxidoreductase